MHTVVAQIDPADVVSLLLAPLTVLASITSVFIGAAAAAAWYLARDDTEDVRRARMAAEVNYAIAIAFGCSVAPAATVFVYAADALRLFTL